MGQYTFFLRRNNFEVVSYVFALKYSMLKHSKGLKIDFLNTLYESSPCCTKVPHLLYESTPQVGRIHTNILL